MYYNHSLRESSTSHSGTAPPPSCDLAIVTKSQLDDASLATVSDSDSNNRRSCCRRRHHRSHERTTSNRRFSSLHFQQFFQVARGDLRRKRDGGGGWAGGEEAGSSSVQSVSRYLIRACVWLPVAAAEASCGCVAVWPPRGLQLVGWCGRGRA